MSGVRMSGALPEGDSNGLPSILRDLIDDPGQAQVAIVVLDTVKLITNIDSGDVVPTVRIRAVEPIAAGIADATELHRLLRRAYERRTGQTELPLEIERELESLADPDADEDGTS